MQPDPLVKLSPRAKLLIAIVVDVVAIAIVTMVATLLRTDSIDSLRGSMLWVAGAISLAGATVFWLNGLYREVTRYVGPVFAVRVVKSCLWLSVVLLAISYLPIWDPAVPRSMTGSFFCVATLVIGGTRLVARWILLGRPVRTPERRVAIFGAGAAGIGLHAALVSARSSDVVAYFDDNPAYFGRRIRGVPVHDPADLETVIGSLDVRIVLLALPSAGRRRRRELVERLARVDVQVLTIPTLAEISDGTARVDQLRPVQIEELLGRAPVAAKPELMSRLVTGKTVLVTGAGGSIGTELCRKILDQAPAEIVVLDASEFALFNIEKELREWIVRHRSSVRLETILGSVVDPLLIESVCRRHAVQTIYHAAACKHVPIVERNESVGVEANLFGTIVVAQVAQRCGVGAFIHVSTDKAVRPSSVMGASKRLAEMAVQALHAESPAGTVMAMVRFGNVLGSSGSVIPIFREQIARGGPVTVTDRRMVRYFMTTHEAAELVIQAGALARGGEVFVLDMGEPVRIEDLARNMIRLAGRTVRDEDNPRGDVEIVYTGVRPGEKLAEELLIETSSSATTHEGIRLANEPFIPWAQFEPQLERLRAAVDQRDAAHIRRLMTEMVRQGGVTEVDLTRMA